MDSMQEISDLIKMASSKNASSKNVTNRIVSLVKGDNIMEQQSMRMS
jgi:hypothetical protein